MCWTVKIGKIDYMDAKTIPGPPSIVSGIFPPSTTTAVIRQVPLRITKFDYHRREPLSECVLLRSSSTRGCTTTVAETPRNASVKFDYPCRVQLPSTPSYSDSSSSYLKRTCMTLPLPSPCATTSTTTIPRTATSSTSHRLDPPRKRTLRRYNPEATLVNECMCVV